MRFGRFCLEHPDGAGTLLLTRRDPPLAVHSPLITVDLVLQNAGLVYSSPMQRRDFLKSAPLAALMPQLRAAVPLKITNIRIVNLKVIRETGKMEAAWNPGTVNTHRIGGGSVIEIQTDQGLLGIGPGMDPASLEAAKAQLIGKDPFSVEQLAGPLRYYVGGSPRTISALEIALWDLIGKATGQPLYKIWGAAKGRVPAYASMIQLSTPEERARMAVQLKSQGWKAIKLRAHYSTLKEDVQMVEAVRKAVGDDMEIMVDANQAQSSGTWQPGVMWDFRRALETARELERLNCVWLEEPRLRYSYDELAELSRLVGIPIAGGENNRGVHEYRWILEQNVYGIVQPDIMVADGVTGFREIAILAQAHHKRVIPHHGGGNLGTIAQLHAIASWTNAPWIEILHDPPVAAYTNGFAIMENPPLVDKDGYLNLPEGPGLGVEINKDLMVA
jgi:D-galactarolactone cycloisomerase